MVSFDERFPNIKNARARAGVWNKNHYVVDCDVMMRVCLDKAVVREAIFKACISLAYQKRNGRIRRVNINHLKLQGLINKELEL